MLSSPATFIAFSVVISIYFFCYPYIYQIASQDLSKEAECEAPAEYPPCQRQEILNHSSGMFILNAVLLALLAGINQVVQMMREAANSKEPAFYKYVQANSREAKDEYIS